MKKIKAVLAGNPNCGKTTVFNLIMGTFALDNGAILFEGTDITGYKTNQRVKIGIARTYQIPRPFVHMTVIENIRASTLKDRVAQLLRKKTGAELAVQIAADVGLKEHLSKYPDELTMGDLRRLELAKVLGSTPRLALFDEIFAGLTVAEIAAISELLQRKREEGLNMVIVSHDLEALAPLVDRVVVLEFGQLIAEGTYAKIVNDERVIKAYFGHKK